MIKHSSVSQQSVAFKPTYISFCFKFLQSSERFEIMIERAINKFIHFNISIWFGEIKTWKRSFQLLILIIFTYCNYGFDVNYSEHTFRTELKSTLFSDFLEARFSSFLVWQTKGSLKYLFRYSYMLGTACIFSKIPNSH